MFVLEAIRRIQEQKGNGYSANVNDGSMKTLIMMTTIQVTYSVHLVDFPHTTFHTSISFVLCIRFSRNSIGKRVIIMKNTVLGSI